MIARVLLAELLEVLEHDTELAGRLRAVFMTDTAPSSTPALLDRAELAKALKVSPATLDRLRGEASFPELTIGDSPRFELERVLSWLRSRSPSEKPANVVDLQIRRTKCTK